MALSRSNLALAPLYDLRSEGRLGPGRRDRFTPQEVALIARTVRRAPEVMVKVLSRGAHDARSVARHFAYLSRHGTVDLEADDGLVVAGRGSEKDLVDDWNIDLDGVRRGGELRSRSQRKPPRMVHKLIFSMPQGTPPDKVLEATRNFAREEFGLQHRYALALHTDEPHPHVHVVVKALSEAGVRLNIKRATLRAWRQQFAQHLRAVGVEANATERVARGETQIQKLDGIFRAAARGESTHMRKRYRDVGAALAQGQYRAGSMETRIVRTRGLVVDGWRAVARTLSAQGEETLAREVQSFIAGFREPKSEQQQIADHLISRNRERTRVGQCR